ncbi:hypothetical protein F5Y12DRAFT_196971 [Xylaria sp. FL1777]|nr:hypothetical protein F5Y12DRAFT_196971 [Xylaria sp. FL1777]
MQKGVRAVIVLKLLQALIAELALTAEPIPSAFAIHFLCDEVDGSKYFHLYQNAALQTGHFNNVSREFLFARFAWAVFPRIRDFVNTSTRHLVIVDNDKAVTHNQWMDNKQFEGLLRKRQESCTGSCTGSRPGSKKRLFDQSTENRDSNAEDDAYKERRKRRSSTLEWFEKYGSHASANLSDNDWDDTEDNTDKKRHRRRRSTLEWFEKYGSHASENLSNNDWDNTKDNNRGRPRHRHMLLESDVDAEDLPGISHSFTTSGLNGSNDKIDPLE